MGITCAKLANNLKQPTNGHWRRRCWETIKVFADANSSATFDEWVSTNEGKGQCLNYQKPR